MKTKFFNWLLILPLSLFLILTIIFWLGLDHDPRQIPSPLIGKHLPHFELSSLMRPQQKLTERDLYGQIALIHVWASWCNTCQLEHAQLIEIAHQYPVLIYGINYKDQPQTAIQWLTDNGNPYQFIINDQQGHLAIDLGVYGTPETFLIDRNGIIRYKYVGLITKEVWIKTLWPQIQRL